MPAQLVCTQSKGVASVVVRLRSRLRSTPGDHSIRSYRVSTAPFARLLAFLNLAHLHAAENLISESDSADASDL